MMLQAVVRMLLAKKRVHRRRAIVVTQRFARGIIGRNRVCAYYKQMTWMILMRAKIVGAEHVV